MPEVSRFLGIVIRMYAEAGAPHHRAHFHAYYQEHAAVYGIDPLIRLGGALPGPQHRPVEAWAELHREELLENWRRLERGRLPSRIEPLGRGSR